MIITLIKNYIIVKILLQAVLWIAILFLGYLIYDSVQAPIEFEKVKKRRYLPTIDRLKDVRKAEIAAREVTGDYIGDWDGLMKFLDTAQFVITERRDTSYLDVEFRRNYGVDKYIQDVVVDTLGYYSVKDSIFKNFDYSSMRYVPGTNKNAEFKLEAGHITEGRLKIPVFEASVDKAVLLEDQDKNFVERERRLQSVDDVSGPIIKVGDMNKVTDSGNWPKNYGKDQE